MLPVKILLLEDNELDAQLIIRVILKKFPNAQILVNNDLDNFKFTIKNQVADVVIADYNLLTFNAMDLLTILQKNKSTIPFIVVSGILNDQETISELFKQGARDFILKKNLNHLTIRLGLILDKLDNLYSKRPKLLEKQKSLKKQLTFLETRMEKLSLMEKDSKHSKLLQTMDFAELQEIVDYYYQKKMEI